MNPNVVANGSHLAEFIDEEVKQYDEWTGVTITCMPIAFQESVALWFI